MPVAQERTASEMKLFLGAFFAGKNPCLAGGKARPEFFGKQVMSCMMQLTFLVFFHHDRPPFRNSA
jgi:hypothetical protein